MGLRIIHVDAFTDRPFSGNPAAVCVLPEPRDDAWMQDVAREMNLSETAFLLREDNAFRLRWFTPTLEIDLCGHATLASAHVLWEEGHLPAGQTAKFHTRSGLLTASRQGDWIEMDFPATPEEEVLFPPAEISPALGTSALYVGKSVFDFLVEVDSEETVRSLKPDFQWLATIDARGVIVTSRSSGTDSDFVSRFFAPAAGINEDPVTGSAHCCLGPFWAKRLNKTGFVARQVSPRGGVVTVKLQGDRVIIGGKAVTVLRAELL